MPGLLDSSAFTIPALAPQQGFECMLRIARLAGSRSDVMLGIGQDEGDATPGNSLGLLVGQPAPSDLQIEKQPSFVADGLVQQVVRISYTNTGSVALDEMGFGRCSDGVTATTRIDFAGACTAPGPSNGGVLCFMGSESFALPGPIAPGTTSSCLVRMTEGAPHGPQFGGGFTAANVVRNSLGGYTALLPSADIDLSIDPVVEGVARAPHRVPAVGVMSMLALGAWLLVPRARQ